MKCENCGAPLKFSKCQYCGHEHDQQKDDDADVNIYINNNYGDNYSSNYYNNKSNVGNQNTNYSNAGTRNTYRSPEYYNQQRKRKNIGLQIFLWLFFWYIMIFVVIIQSKSLSRTAKIVLCSVIGLLLFSPVIAGFGQAIAEINNGTSQDAQPSPAYYQMDTLVGDEDFEIKILDCWVEGENDDQLIIIEYDMKYVGTYKVYPSHLEYKLQDDDGLLFEEMTYYPDDTIPSLLEPNEKGRGMLAFKMTYDVETDLFLHIHDSAYTSLVDCDVTFRIPQERLTAKVNE